MRNLSPVDIDLTWLVLAGGSGTRSANPALPKILQEIGGKSLLLHHLETLYNDARTNVLFVLSHGSEQVIAEIQKFRASFESLEIRFVIDEGLGPVNALKGAVSEITTEHTAVILGDSAIDAPLIEISRHAVKAFSRGYRACVGLRQSDHLFDSNFVMLDWQGCIESFNLKGSAIRATEGSVWGTTGLYFLHTVDIAGLDASALDVVEGIFRAIEPRRISPIRLSHYFRDTGTPARLQSVRQDSKNGLFRGGVPLTNRRAVFFDRDGTLVPNIDRGRKETLQIDLNPDAVDSIKLLNERRIPVFMVTNQPAVAKGFITLSDVYRSNNQLQNLLWDSEAHLDDWEFCPHHPSRGFTGERLDFKVDCPCRKPKSGMLKSLASRHFLELDKESILVGDSEADRVAAESVGLTFVDVRHIEDGLESILK